MHQAALSVHLTAMGRSNSIMGPVSVQPPCQNLDGLLVWWADTMERFADRSEALQHATTKTTTQQSELGTKLFERYDQHKFGCAL